MFGINDNKTSIILFFKFYSGFIYLLDKFMTRNAVYLHVMKLIQ
jgi:hypothetical protein